MARSLLLAFLLLFRLVPQRPEFEVASFKTSPPSAPGEPININLGAFRNGRLTFGNASLSDLIKYAWGLASNEQISGPDWINQTRFDIIALTAGEAKPDEVTLMLQSLLSDRLKLAVDHEDRQLSYVALVVAKSGSKLAGAKEGAANITTLGHINHNHMSMQLLATLLSRFERQLLLDKTSLQGFYTVKLEWTPENVRARAGGLSGVDPNGPSLSTALQEQIGLRLESRKGPVDVLVIDHAERTPQ